MAADPNLLSMTQALYNAGFRGSSLQEMVAIGIRESGGNPSAHNGNASTGDDSWGWFQINYFQGLAQSRTQQFGAPQQLISSPENQAKAAWALSNGGTNFQPWSTSKGLSPEVLSTAGQIIDDAQSQGLFTAGASQLAPSGTTAPQSPNTTGTSIDPNGFSIPKDGAVFNIAGQAPVIVYDLGNGVKVYFDFSAPGTNVQSLMGNEYALGSPMAPNIDPTSFYSGRGPGWSPTSNMIHGGTVQALAGLGNMQGSFIQWINKQLLTLSGGNQDWINDPQIKGLLVQTALGQIDQATLEVQVKQTAYWKQHTQGQVDFKNLSPAEQQQRINQEMVQVQNLYGDWGIHSAPADLNQWSQQIANGSKTEQDLQLQLQQQASVAYPWMSDFAKQGISTKTAASPWLSTYSTVMEKPADLFNPQVQGALTKGLPVYQFEQQLKQTPDWLNTKNAMTEMTGAATQVAKTMGFQ